MIRAKLAAGLLAFTIGAAAIDAPAPAAAAGSVSVTIAPKGESANAIRDGFSLFSWVRQMRRSARIDQKGSGNGAAVSQSGRWNWAAIFQRGRPLCDRHAEREQQRVRRLPVRPEYKHGRRPSRQWPSRSGVAVWLVSEMA